MASWSSPRSGVSPSAGRRPMEGTPKTVTISREADGWYVCFSCADVPVQPLPATGQETGIDLGIEAFATLSDGTRIFSPGWYRKAERALKTAQRRVSRRKKGSNRRSKAVTLLAEGASEGAAPASGLSPQDGARPRASQRHDLSRGLADGQHAQEPPPRQEYLDAGWSAFLSILAFKAACAGKRVVAVPPAYTSQMCSGCGVLVAKGLSVRWHAARTVEPACIGTTTPPRT